MINLSPSSAIDFKSPYEMRYHCVPDYSRLRIFGCDAYAHTPKALRTKLDPKALKCIFLGYQRGVKGYRLWDPIDCELVVSRDVSFNEPRLLKEGERSISLPDKGKSPMEEMEPMRDALEEVLVPEWEHWEDDSTEDVDHRPEQIEELPESSNRRSHRIRNPVVRFADMVPSEEMVLEGEANNTGGALLIEEGEPASFMEAKSSSEKLEWDKAMEKEYKSLMDNKTWELVKLPEGKKVVDSKWIYKIKDGAGDGADKIYKARLVAKGFTQQKGVDYNEVFAPVAKYSSIRLLCVLVTLFGLVLDQMDVVTAFLYGLLDEIIFMRQPQGFTRKGYENLVCKLLKSIYGLKQSPRQWYKRFDDFMIAQGFLRSVFDPCVYMKKVSNSVFGWIILVLYVDDMLIAAKDESEVAKLKTLLSSEFSMKDLGHAKRILGMEITRDVRAGKLWLSQRKYAEKILERFSMDKAKSVSTPLAAHFKLSVSDGPDSVEEKGLMSLIPYESVVGSLMYLMVCTRPDLAYAMSIVSRYMSNPGKRHWEAVKWILRYLKGTVGTCLLFDAKAQDALMLTGYVDADYAQDLDKRRSISGFVFTLGGGCISWKAILQKCVSQSTTEAEYVAAAEAAKEAIWLGRLVTDMGLMQRSITLHCDSMSAIHLAVNQKMDGRLKHIDIRYHYLREVVDEKKIDLTKIGGKDNPADALTKVIPLEVFVKHKVKLQIVQVVT